MKSKLIITSVFASLLAMSGLFATQAEAHGYYRGGWVAPALVGGIVGYSLARPYYPPTYYVPPPQVVYVQPPVVVQQPAPQGYVQQTILDGTCNCYRTVLVPQQ